MPPAFLSEADARGIDNLITHLDCGLSALNDRAEWGVCQLLVLVTLLQVGTTQHLQEKAAASIAITKPVWLTALGSVTGVVQMRCISDSKRYDQVWSSLNKAKSEQGSDSLKLTDHRAWQ